MVDSSIYHFNILLYAVDSILADLKKILCKSENSKYFIGILHAISCGFWVWNMVDNRNKQCYMGNTIVK